MKRLFLSTGFLVMVAVSAWSQVTVAIQPLSAPASAAEEEELRKLSARLPDMLAQQVVKLPDVSLLDRQHVTKLLEEQHFAATSTVDRAAADNMGRMLRVDVMLMVSFYPLQNSGMISKFVGDRHWTASADAVEVATGRVVTKAVCGAMANDAEVTACAQQIVRELKPAVASLWNAKQQRAKAQAEAQQQQAKTEAEARSAAAASLQREEEQQRVAAQQRTQTLRVEELRRAEGLQRERTEQERLSLQRMQEEKRQKDAQARLDAELERVRTRFGDLAGEASAMLDYWARFARELQGQRGGTLRSEIRSANARLKTDMDGASDCLRNRQLAEALSYMEKARKEIETLEQMK